MSLDSVLKDNPKAAKSLLRILNAYESNRSPKTSDICNVGILAMKDADADAEFYSLLKTGDNKLVNPI
jgi:hypothetical protein